MLHEKVYARVRSVWASAAPFLIGGEVCALEEPVRRRVVIGHAREAEDSGVLMSVERSEARQSLFEEPALRLGALAVGRVLKEARKVL